MAIVIINWVVEQLEPIKFIVNFTVTTFIDWAVVKTIGSPVIKEPVKRSIIQ